MNPFTLNPADLAAFRKLDAGAQRKHLIGQKVERNFTFDRAGIDEEKRTVWLSIASDQPYERWWGVEILDMRRKSIRDQRLKQGLSILVDHDSTDIVGKAESYEFTTDNKLRLLARFGKSARAQEIFQDVIDGIRTDTSVGYVIHDLVLEKQEENKSTYRVTDWEPLEGSLVSIPADPSVGVGRSFEPPTRKENIMTPEEIRAAAEKQVREEIEAKRQADAAAAAKAAADAAELQRQIDASNARIHSLLAAGDLFKDQGGPELARELIKDPKATEETFKARMFELQRGKQTPTPVSHPNQGAQFGEGARQILRYSALRAFKDQTFEDGKTMKAEEAAYRAGQWLAAAVYRKENAMKWCRDHGIGVPGSHEVRVMTGNSLAAGGALIPQEMENAIIDLRDTYGAARQLARIRPMATDSLSVPRRESGLTAYFFGDDDGAGLTASDKGWGNVSFTAKKLGILARVGDDLIEDAAINVVDDLAMEMGWAFAKKEDECWIDGDGTSTYGGMTGLRPKFVATAYASRITLATNHDLMSEVDATDLANVMAGIAQFARPGANWLCSGTFKASVFDRIVGTAGGNSVQTLAGMVQPSYLGYPIVTSEAMPSDTTTDFTSLVMAMFGNFRQSTSLAARRGITIKVLTERYAELGQLGIIGTERFDLVNHDLGSTTAKGPVAAAYGA